MIDQQSVERAAERFSAPEGSFERLALRRNRKRRNQRIRAGALGLAIAIAVGWLGVNAIRSTPPVPADPPDETSVDLGIFEPVAGRIVYYAAGRGLWAVDPNAPSPISTLVSIGADGQFASFTTPLGWSSDGTELLFLRQEPTDESSPWGTYLYILHADGTETQVVPEPVEGAAISPDGSRVAFATDGLYVVDVEGGQPVRIAQEGNSPTFSPDGRQIAYLSLPRRGCCVESGREHVWIANADGTDAHEILTDEPALDKGVFELQWSPAGDRIAMENSLNNHVAIYTFAPDGSDFMKVITGGMNPFWSPDGSQIAYTGPGAGGASKTSVSIADADGSDVQTFGFGGPGPWHPGAGGGEGADIVDPTPSRFVGEWAATDYNNYFGAEDTFLQTMTIRTGEDGVLHITIHDDSECVPDATTQTMTGTGRLEDPTILLVPSSDLTCVDGSAEARDRIDLFDGYTLVLDPATDRLYDSLGVVWNRGTAPESWTGPSTQRGVDGPGTFSILHGEATFRADGFWNDHIEAYIDPRVFFLDAPEGEGTSEAGMTILVNPLPPENSCGRRVPPSAEELVQAIRSNPELEATAPVIEPVGGVDALRMDVVAAPGASVGPCTAADDSVDVVNVPGRPWANVGLGDLGRVYVLDLPGGSARTLAILITAPDATVFEQAVDAAAPILDSFQFQAP